MTPGHMRRLREAIDTQLKLYQKETGSKVNSTIVMSPDIVLILPRRQSGNRTGSLRLARSPPDLVNSGIGDLGRADGHKHYQCDGPFAATRYQE
jgi:hypothetical protein